jgi:ornithine carbamoyltransferase
VSAGAKVTVVRDPNSACEGADVISTDVWASMGQESESERRKRAFAAYCVTSELVALAAKDVVVLHCLPAHRGEEIEADVIEGSRSFVWDQAEARLHTGKAVLVWALGKS